MYIYIYMYWWIDAWMETYMNRSIDWRVDRWCPSQTFKWLLSMKTRATFSGFNLHFLKWSNGCSKNWHSDSSKWKKRQTSQIPFSGKQWLVVAVLEFCSTLFKSNPVASSAFHVDHHPGTFIFDAGMVTTIATVGWSYSILYALVHNPQSIW